MHQICTDEKLITLLPRLWEADKVRLLQFAEAMIEQRAGKRRVRMKRFEQHQRLREQHRVN
jgi:hypothetical protein